MDLSLFTSDTDLNNDNNQDLKIEKYYQKYNFRNIEITKSNLNKLLKKYNITKNVKNIQLFQKAFIHISYCYNEDKINDLTESSYEYYKKHMLNKNMCFSKKHMFFVRKHMFFL